MHTRFSGLWLPIITPYAADGGIDHAALAALAQDRAQHGLAGLVAGATTGEGVLLSADEQEAVFATLRAAVPQLHLL